MKPAAFVYSTRPGDAYRAGRTLRSLQMAGIAGEELGEATAERLQAILRPGAPILLMRAGAWLTRPYHFVFPHVSATRKGLCALGSVRAPEESEPETTILAEAWKGATG